MSGRGRCPNCDSGTLTGDGKCKYCHGSGTNLNVASDVPQCVYCKGTGICPSCKGEGTSSNFDDFQPGRIQKLFE